MSRVTSTQIVNLLRERHKEDLFFNEVLCGAAGSMRIDGYAIRRSWTAPLTIGYEVKVTRHDFLRDSKWEAYLDECHAFSFVAPKGLIDANELPAAVGLIELLGEKRLVTRRKPVSREITYPWRTVHHCLMHHCASVGRVKEHMTREKRIAQISEGRVCAETLAQNVSLILKSKVKAAETRASTYKAQSDRYKQLINVLREFELPENYWALRWALQGLRKKSESGGVDLDPVKKALVCALESIDKALAKKEVEG